MTMGSKGLGLHFPGYRKKLLNVPYPWEELP